MLCCFAMRSMSSWVTALAAGHVPLLHAICWVTKHASILPCPRLQEEYEKERAMVDEVMRRIEQEEAAEAEARRKRQRDTQAEIHAFMEQQQELKKRWVQWQSPLQGGRVTGVGIWPQDCAA